MTMHERLGHLDTAATVDDVAFDEALDQITLLAARLHAVLSLHEPRPALFGQPKCAACRRRWPCPTAHRAALVRPGESAAVSRVASRRCVPADAVTHPEPGRPVHVLPA